MTMSKLNIRIILAVLISLGVIFAVVTTVQGASLNSADKGSSHFSSDALTNYGGFIVTQRDAYYSQLDAYNSSQAVDGHDCGQSYNGPID